MEKRNRGLGCSVSLLTLRSVCVGGCTVVSFFICRVFFFFQGWASKPSLPPGWASAVPLSCTLVLRLILNSTLLELMKLNAFSVLVHLDIFSIRFRIKSPHPPLLLLPFLLQILCLSLTYLQAFSQDSGRKSFEGHMYDSFST